MCRNCVVKTDLWGGAAVNPSMSPLGCTAFNCNTDLWVGVAENLAKMSDEETDQQANVHFRTTQVLTVDRLISNDTLTTSNIKHD